ncbi:MAG: hypothetical protein ACKVP0_13810 [Pirellulaceae bacterium]
MTSNLFPRPSHPTAAAVPQPEPLETTAHHFFPPTEEVELAKEDHEAWTAVCTVLITIVSLGLCIGIAAVLLII